MVYAVLRGERMLLWILMRHPADGLSRHLPERRLIEIHLALRFPECIEDED